MQGRHQIPYKEPGSALSSRLLHAFPSSALYPLTVKAVIMPERVIVVGAGCTRTPPHLRMHHHDADANHRQCPA